MVKTFIPTTSDHQATESDNKKYVGRGLSTLLSPHLLWAMAAVGIIAAIAAAFRLSSAPMPARAAPAVPVSEASRVLSQETSDWDAARAICSAAVARMIGEPAADRLAARNTFPVTTMEPGVVTVQVKVRESNVANPGRASSFRCQATNQTGRWEAESVSEIRP